MYFGQLRRTVAIQSDQNISKVGLLMSLTIDQGGIGRFCQHGDKSVQPMNPLMRIRPTIDCID